MKFKSYEKKILNLLGFLFLVYGILAIFNTIRLGDFIGILWICYFSLILIGIGIILRSSLLVMSQVNILLIADIFWNVDFFYNFFVGSSLLGITDYLFEFFRGREFFSAIISLQHIFILPLALYALYILGVSKKGAWKLSVLQVSLIFAVTKAIGFGGENINCVFRPCVNINLPIPYFVLWFSVYFLFIFVSEIVLRNSLPYRKRIKN